MDPDDNDIIVMPTCFCGQQISYHVNKIINFELDDFFPYPQPSVIVRLL